MATNDLIPGAVYYSGERFSARVVAVVEDIEVDDDCWPVFVVVEDFENGKSVGCGLCCDDDNGSGVMEDRLLDEIRQPGEGESWADVIRAEFLADYNEPDTDDSWRQERAMQAGMAFGVQGYNDAMGYSVDDPDEYWDDEY
jgi:hypothetical protein